MAELRGKNTIASCFRETPGTIYWHESVCSSSRTTHDDNNVIIHPWIPKQREFPNKRTSEFWQHIPADSNYWNIDLLAALAEVIPSCSGADVPAPYTDANPVYTGFASVRLWHMTRADGPSWRPVRTARHDGRCLLATILTAVTTDVKRLPSMPRILLITSSKMMAAVNMFRFINQWKKNPSCQVKTVSIKEQ